MSNVDLEEIASALARYEGFLKVDPENVYLWKTIADLRHRTGDFEGALQCYERLAELQPGDRGTLGNAARVMISQHRFADAEKAYKDLLGGAPVPDVNLLHNLGLAVYFQERWEEALHLFEQAREGGLEDAQNYAYVTYALHHLGNVQRALEAGHAWQSADPSDPGANAYLALLEMDAGDMPAARARAEAVLSEQPDNTDASVVVAYAALEEQDADTALGYVTHVTRAEPDNPRGWLAMGLIEMLRQRHREAIAHLERTLEMLPRNAGIWVTLGWARIANDDLNGAEVAFARAIEVERTFGEAHGGMASVLALQKQHAQAKASIVRARRLNPAGFGWVFAQSVLLEAEGERDSAVQLMAEAFQRSPREGSITLIEAVQRFAARQPGNRGPSPRQPRLR